MTTDHATTATPATGPDWTLSVDFGTTSTVAAMTTADGTTDVLEIGGERRTPSVVLVDDDGTLVVGAAAVGLASSRPDRTIRSPKRRLGDQTPVILGGKPFSPVDLAAAVLRHVLAEAERHVGSLPTAVRLTHPATWGQPLRQRLLEAAAKAGMPSADLVAEPVAAAMSAADASLPVGSHIAVYDLGGGTFDTTVVRTTETGHVVVGHPIGDRQIGGELFDEALMNHVGSRLDPEMWEKLQVSDELAWHQAASRLLDECRRVKESLSAHGYGEVVLGTPTGMIGETVTRDELESIVAPHLGASIDLLHRCVDEADLDPEDLASIHMIGGASRMPLAVQMVQEAFPGVEVSRRGDPRTAVAVGAALVDLDAQTNDVVADGNTTIERRERSIDTEAAAIDAAARSRQIAPPSHPTAGPPTHRRPEEPTVAGSATTPAEPAIAEPAADTPATDTPATGAPAAGTVFEPGHPGHAVSDRADSNGADSDHAASRGNGPAPVRPSASAGGLADPSISGPPPSDPALVGATSPSSSSSPGLTSPPVLAGLGVLALVVIAAMVWMVQSFGDEPEAATVTSAQKNVQTATVQTATTAQPVTPSSLLPPTTVAPTTTTESTTTLPAGGPSRDDAIDLLFDAEELPGDDWVGENFAYDPIAPCDDVGPFQPVFVEGRQFTRNKGQPDVVILGHQVLVYANEAEAAAVMDSAIALGETCPTDEITGENGVTFTAVYQSCDPFATCEQGLPAENSAFLSGDQFVLQLAVLVADNEMPPIVDQVLSMRFGRSIIAVEYVVPDRPSEAQLFEATAIALDAWGRTDGYPR